MLNGVGELFLDLIWTRMHFSVVILGSVNLFLQRRSKNSTDAQLAPGI